MPMTSGTRPMERKWMYGMNISYPKYVNGVQSFLIVVESDRVAKGNIEIFLSVYENLNEMLHDLGANDGDIDQEDLQQLFEEAEKPVYDGCDFSILSAVLELLKLKPSSSWSDTSFTKLLDFMHRLLPKNNELPISTYQAKNIMRPMGLEIKRIHSCPNDYMLYRDEYENLHACVTCETSRYKKEPDEIDDDATKRARHAGRWYIHVLGRDPITEVFGKEHGGRTKGVSTILGVRTTLGWVKGDKERHHIVDIKAITENVTKTVTAAFQDKFDSQKTQMDSQKTEIEGLKAIVAHLEGRESPTCLDSSCASDKFDDLEEFRVAIGKVYPTWDPTLHGSSISEGHIKMKAILRKDKYLAAIGERPAERREKCKELGSSARLYEARLLHNKNFLKRKLYALRMTESTLVTEHVNNLNALFSQLTSLSCKIDSQERAEILLQRLPDSYDQVIINLTSNVLLDYLVFDDVAAAILKEENRYNNREDRKDCWGLNTSYPQGNVASTSEDGNALCYEAAIANESRKIFADLCCNDHELKFIGIGSIMVKMHDVHGIKSFDICQNKEEVFMERKLLPGTHKRSVYVLELVHSDVRQVVFILGGVERITKKRTKNKAKTTKPDSEWKRL
ncbi:hypothetical protein Tco_1343642 [Tanacetum coccineum]